MTHYLINTDVVKIERKSRAKSMNVIGKDPETGKNIYEIEREDMGWFVLLKNSHEWLFLGYQEPKLQPGQQVTVRIEPR
jgi:hypothetical protein